MIESATERDLPESRALLERLQLPLAGVAEHVPTMLVARNGEQIVGTAALVLSADGALRRSVGMGECRRGGQEQRRCQEEASLHGRNLAQVHLSATAVIGRFIGRCHRADLAL